MAGRRNQRSFGSVFVRDSSNLSCLLQRRFNTALQRWLLVVSLSRLLRHFIEDGPRPRLTAPRASDISLPDRSDLTSSIGPACLTISMRT